MNLASPNDIVSVMRLFFFRISTTTCSLLLFFLVSWDINDGWEIKVSISPLNSLPRLNVKKKPEVELFNIFYRINNEIYYYDLFYIYFQTL